MSEDLEHFDFFKETSNVWLQTPPTQEEVGPGSVTDSQVSPDEKSE